MSKLEIGLHAATWALILCAMWLSQMVPMLLSVFTTLMLAPYWLFIMLRWFPDRSRCSA